MGVLNELEDALQKQRARLGGNIRILVRPDFIKKIIGENIIIKDEVTREEKLLGYPVIVTEYLPEDKPFMIISLIKQPIHKRELNNDS
jgi:hypothetical protein